MKRVNTVIALIWLLCFAAPQVSSARTSWRQGTAGKAVSSDCVVRFHNLGRYRGDRWSRVFRDREVAPALKGLLKNEYRKLVDSLERVNYPEDSLSLVDSRGVLRLEGGVPGLYTIREAILIVEPCGNIYAAILDQGERILYFTNDREYTGRLPPAIEDWRARTERARSSPVSKPELPVVFKNQ
jgi:hypothetical protein